MNHPSKFKILAAASMMLFLAGCIVLPARSGGGDQGGGKYDLEKSLDFGRTAVINTLDAVLVKQGFTVTSKDAALGHLSARKTGLLASDYGYYRFQKFCFLWGYGAYGTMLLDARAESEGPKKTRLGLNSTPDAPGTLKKTMEELELKLFLEDKPR